MLEAPRLEDDYLAVKMAEDETIEEMVRRMERELDHEFKDFDLEEVVVGNVIATAKNPTIAATAANVTTTTAATTAASSTATGGAGRTSAEAAVDAKRASKAEPTPSRHHRQQRRQHYRHPEPQVDRIRNPQ